MVERQNLTDSARRHHTITIRCQIVSGRSPLSSPQLPLLLINKLVPLHRDYDSLSGVG